MNVIEYIDLVLLASLTAAVLYLCLLAFFGIIGRKKKPGVPGDYRFLILIPAHNEEAVISRTLDSLKGLEQGEKADIAVIADNCDDRTAEVARAGGVRALERNDPQNRGKGFALEWAIGQHNLDEYDVVVVVDADTLVESNMLSVMAADFDRGVGAVQLDDVLMVEGDKPLAHLQHLANAAENRFFYNGRAALGLPVLLRGTGMAIKAEVLQAHPYKSHSVTEDVDYAVDLLMGGVKITYTQDSAVYSPATSTYDQSVSQKERWAAGTFRLIGKRVFRLLRTGLTKGRLDLLELAFSLLILSRPVLIYLGIVVILLAIPASSGLRIYFALWGMALIAVLVLYLLSGVFLVKDKKSALKGVLHAPYYGFWLLQVQLRALLRPGRVGWTRTERKD